MSKQNYRLHERATVPKETLLRQLTSSGLTVVRLKPYSKSPAGGSSWQQRATKDLRVIKSWRDCNYGVLAGTQLPNGNRLVIIDVDCKNGKNGRKSFQVLRQDFSLPPTAYSITPSGGEHHYYTAPPDTPLTGISQLLQTLRYEGLDLLGNGLFAVEAPSVLPTGEYEWMRFPSEGLSELPIAFLSLLRLRGRTKPQECDGSKRRYLSMDRITPTSPTKTGCNSDREHRFYKRICRRFPVMGPGQRNNRMSRAVLYLFDRGLSAETVTKIMTFWLEHFQDSMSTPLEEASRELGYTISSTLQKIERGGLDRPSVHEDLIAAEGLHPSLQEFLRSLAGNPNCGSYLDKNHTVPSSSPSKNSRRLSQREERFVTLLLANYQYQNRISDDIETVTMTNNGIKDVWEAKYGEELHDEQFRRLRDRFVTRFVADGKRKTATKRELFIRERVGDFGKPSVYRVSQELQEALGRVGREYHPER